MKLDFIAMVLLPTLAAVITFSCPDHPPGNAPGGAGPDYTTIHGVRVTSPVVVPPEALQAVDEGIQNTIERMPVNWTGGRNLAEYRVEFVAPAGIGSQGNPYVLRGGIPTWGYVSGISTDPKQDHMVIVMPYQQDWAHPEWVSGTAWSESEHIVERLASIQLNDREIFWKWQRAGADDSHPHRP